MKWNLVRIFENVNGIKIPSTAMLNENLQLADKLYFNNGKLSADDKQTVLSITQGDNYTKFIADCLIYSNEHIHYSNPAKELRRIYESIKNYNKNVFPISGFPSDINKVNGADLIYPLEKREKIIELFKQLPSIATRNLKAEIRQERNANELENYRHLTEYLVGHIGYIANRNDKTQSKIFQKMFKNGVTMDQLIDFVEDKQNLLGGEKVTKNEILKVVKENDMKIVYQQGKIMVIRVESPQAIKNIGCTSLWCFTYGSGFDDAYRQWNNYSTNDTVYVIIDFSVESDSSDFMHVVIKPLDWDEEESGFDDDSGEGVNNYKVFDMGNDQLDNPLPYLKHVFGNLETAKNIFTFEWD